MSVNLNIIDRYKTQLDQGEWAWFIPYSIGANRSATTPTQTLPQYTISTMVILPPCHHSGLVLWHLIILQGIIFFSTIHLLIQTFHGGLLLQPSYKPNHHSCPTPSHQTLGAWLLHLFYQENYSTNTTQSFFINMANNILSIGALLLLLFFDSRYYFQRCSGSFEVLSLSKMGTDDTDR
jgi:hypothetical protein